MHKELNQKKIDWDEVDEMNQELYSTDKSTQIEMSNE